MGIGVRVITSKDESEDGDHDECEDEYINECLEDE